MKATVISFSFKRGIPDDPTGNGGGFVFDCRAMPNPFWDETLRGYTGRDKPVGTSSPDSRRRSSRSLKRPRRLSASLSSNTNAMAATIFKSPSAALVGNTAPCTSPSAWQSDWQTLMVLKLKSPTRRNNTGRPAVPRRIVV